MSKFFTALLFSIMAVVIILEMAPVNTAGISTNVVKNPPNAVKIQTNDAKNGKLTTQPGGYTVTDAHFKVEKANFVVKDVTTSVKVSNPGFKFK